LRQFAKLLYFAKIIFNTAKHFSFSLHILVFAKKINKIMLKEERFEIILEALEKDKIVTYDTFSSLISVSEDTIRRDVDYLYRNGLLSKVRGGAMLREKDPLSFQDRTFFATDAKSIIGLKAQKIIKNGMTIFMDGGTTVCAIAHHFSIDISLRIITNNPALIPILAKFKNVELIVLGGTYHQETATTTGAGTCIEATQYIADMFFMGTCALDSELGVSAIFKTDAEVKRIMIKCSKKVIVLADENKFRRTEPFKICSIQDVDVIITNLPGHHNELTLFHDKNIQIL